MAGIDETLTFTPIRIAILVVSDTRSLETDTSGALLAQRITDAGHSVADRVIVKDDIAALRRQVEGWIGDPAIDVVISTGGTGLTGRDVTPEALSLQSRAIAGLAAGTFIFCLPGSKGAVKDGWDKVIRYQLDSRHTPCNLVELMPRLKEH